MSTQHQQEQQPQQEQSQIDPDTKKHHLQARSLKTDRVFDLVVSDEYSTDGRSFKAGEDPIFEAIDQPDFTNNAMQFYDSSPSYVTTKDGHLVISTRAEKTSWNVFDPTTQTSEVHTKNYTSGMVQSWNKFCFTGGILELSVQLPGGQADAGGLWPAAWLMGNLARAIFPESTMAMWPWSYDKCGDISGLEWKQEVSACDPDPGHGMHPYQGRGSPEIDLFEVMLGHSMPGQDHVPAFMSSSLQISPGVDKNIRPHNGFKLNDSVTWYKDIEMNDASEFNFGFWGQWCGPEVDDSVDHKRKYLQDAISVNTNLRESHFEKQHKYRIEWEPDPSDGYLQWYLDDELIMSLDARVLETTGARIPAEPMYVILNTAVSHSWGFPEPCDVEHCAACYQCYDCTNPDCQCALPEGMRNCDNLPADMKIDYIRLYQDKQAAAHTLSCSPHDFPTSAFISDHPERYQPWDGSQKIRLNGRHERSFPIYFWCFIVVMTLACSVLIDYFFFNNKIFKMNVRLLHTTSEKGADEQHDGIGMRCGGVQKNEKSPLLVRKL